MQEIRGIPITRQGLNPYELDLVDGFLQYTASGYSTKFFGQEVAGTGISVIQEIDPNNHNIQKSEDGNENYQRQLIVQIHSVESSELVTSNDEYLKLFGDFGILQNNTNSTPPFSLTIRDVSLDRVRKLSQRASHH